MSIAVSWVRRAAASLPLVALALPVVLVRDCQTHEESVRYGWQLFSDGGWVALAPATAYALWRIVRPALPERETLHGRLASLRTWTVEAAIGLAALVLPLFSTLFDTVSYRVGFWVEAVGWGALWVTAAVNAVRALVGYPVQPAGSTAGALVATWLRLLSVVAVFGVTAYGLAHDDLDPGASALGAVVGVPLAIWSWALSRSLHEPAARRTTAVLMALAIALAASMVSNEEPLFVVLPGGLFTVVAAGALFVQSRVTSDH